MNRSYIIALICGALPLCTGILIFIAWLQTEAGWLETAGFFNIAAGCIFFFIGFVALLAYCRTNPPPRHLKRRSVIAAMLLLANFPAAAGIAYAAYWIDTSYIVTVRNESGETLSDVQVEGGGVVEEFGDIPAGKTVRRYMRVGEGQLVFSTSAKGMHFRHHSRVIQDYVAAGLGGRSTVIVKPAGQVEVTDG